MSQQPVLVPQTFQTVIGVLMVAALSVWVLSLIRKLAKGEEVPGPRAIFGGL